MPATIVCDPAALAKASACYCLPEPAALAAIIYLLNVSGPNLTPSALAAASAKFRDMPDNAKKAAIVWLTCQAATAAGA